MGAPVNPYLAGGSLLSSLGLQFLSAHHEKAVTTENNTLGAQLPATEEAFKKIMDSFSAGMIDASEADGKIQSAVDAFKSATAAIRKQNGKAGETGDPKAGGQCNAACVWLFKLQAEADDLKKQIQAGTGGDISATSTKSGGRSVIQMPGAKGAVPTQQFSILPNLTGNTLALALGGIILFLVAVAIAMAARKSGRG